MTTEVKEVLNSKGSPIVLNEAESQMCERLNALGYDVPITTLTAIHKRVVEQKFFTVPPADYVPLKVGENSWSDQIITYRDYSIGGDFETGIVNTATSDARLSEVSSGIDTLTNPVMNWAKVSRWTIPELQFAAKSGNWDIVTSKEKARKKNWDLGIQNVAFLGLRANPNVLGLLNQTTVNANTTLLAGYISGLNVSDFQTFVANVVQAYRSNCNYTAYPTHFIIPEADYNGLASAVDETFNLKSRITRLQEVFSELTMNPSFKIKPLAYANKLNNAAVTGLNKNRYTLLNYDEDSVRMDVPVDYSNTMQNTINGYQFENVGYGQFSGVLAYRPLEMLYIDWG
jgi:hypothetical protein